MLFLGKKSREPQVCVSQGSPEEQPLELLYIKSGLVRLAYMISPGWPHSDLCTLSENQSCSVHQARYLSSPHLLPKAWGIPREPLVFIPCGKAENLSSDIFMGRQWWQQQLVRQESRQRVESHSHWASLDSAAAAWCCPC